MSKRKVGKSIAGERHLSSGVHQSSKVDGGAVADGDTSSAGEVTERGGGPTCSIGVQIDGTSDGGQRNVDICQVLVVGNVDRLSTCQVDTVQVLEEGVLNIKGTNSLQTSSPVEHLKVRSKGVESQRTNAGQVAEVESIQTNKALQVQRVANGAESRGSDGGNVASALGRQGASDLPDTAEVKVTRS